VDLAPTQTTGLIRKRSLSGGRANQGRIYVGFPSNDWVSATGGIVAGGITALQDIANAIGNDQTIVGATGTTNLNLAIWYYGGPVDYTLVSSLAVSAQWATQRRRGQFGRRNAPPF